MKKVKNKFEDWITKIFVCYFLNCGHNWSGIVKEKRSGKLYKFCVNCNAVKEV